MKTKVRRSIPTGLLWAACYYYENNYDADYKSEDLSLFKFFAKRRAKKMSCYATVEDYRNDRWFRKIINYFNNIIDKIIAKSEKEVYYQDGVKVKQVCKD